MFLFTLLYFTSLDRCGYTDQKFRDLVTQLQQLTEENQMDDNIKWQNGHFFIPAVK
jgi:hypothetical protein